MSGWVNVDNSLNARLSKFPGIRFILFKLGLISSNAYEANFDVKNITFFDITRTFPYMDSTVDYIYSSHTFEHLTAENGKLAARECYRVLKSSGVFRIVVPDLFEPAKKYVDELAVFIPRAKAGNFEIEPTIDINNLYHTKMKLFDHKYMYDFISLGRLLSQAGFEDIRKSSALDSEIPEIEQIEKRRDASANLFVECIKK